LNAIRKRAEGLSVHPEEDILKQKMHDETKDLISEVLSAASKVSVGVGSPFLLALSLWPRHHTPSRRRQVSPALSPAQLADAVTAFADALRTLKQRAQAYREELQILQDTPDPVLGPLGAIRLSRALSWLRSGCVA
jgi:hypothetical protein